MPTTPEDPATIWVAGGFDAKHAARWLGVSESLFKQLAKRLKWPRKRVRTTRKVVYSRVVLRAFLASCEDA